MIMYLYSYISLCVFASGLAMANWLLDRVTSENVTEVILALGATIDGQTTAHYIADQLNGISVTSLAQGVPVGGELDYLDDGTITAALNARKALYATDFL